MTNEHTFKTEEFTINMGPQHPSTHGVFRLVLTLDGETVTNAESVVGYLHRGVEKLAEARTYTQVIPYTERMDYLSGMTTNLGYVQAVEKLMGLEVPERAEYIRVIMAELQRIASHMVAIGTFVQDLGVTGASAFMYPFRDRERILDLFEMVTGSRLTYSYMRIGGVAADLTPEFIPNLEKLLDDLPACLEEYWALSSENEIFQARIKGIGIISAQDAISWGFSGSNLRGSGVNYDLRKAEPYGIYDRFDFDVPVAENGDTWDRFMCRGAEVYESIKILRQAIKDIPEGPIMAKVPKVIKPPKGEVYHQIESSRGILGYYVVSDGSTKPYRWHVRRPSFINLMPLDETLIGLKIADAVAVLGSIDIVLGEVDC
ncbi:NADH-quinone oxidoreductase subunit D [Desulfitispora alkaliphila]|uniref:NADH-quinone oxidoreductase subunit D n=1 Tax=Desulfitispora alkaliphila TaxID=622674 RepID=UPI003D1B831E